MALLLVINFYINLVLYKSSHLEQSKAFHFALYPSSQQNLPGGQRDQGHWVLLHDQEEGYQQPLTFLGVYK